MKQLRGRQREPASLAQLLAIKALVEECVEIMERMRSILAFGWYPTIASVGCEREYNPQKGLPEVKRIDPDAILKWVVWSSYRSESGDEERVWDAKIENLLKGEAGTALWLLKKQKQQLLELARSHGIRIEKRRILALEER